MALSPFLYQESLACTAEYVPFLEEMYNSGFNFLLNVLKKCTVKELRYVGAKLAL